MLALPELLARAHLPLTALALVAGLVIAAGSRDLMKRLLGATLAMLAAAAHAAAISADGAAMAAILIAFAGGALGLALIVRLREGFGGVAVRRVQGGLEADDAERET